MQYVFVGATRGMGRALARRMVARGDKLFLLGRDAEGLHRCATDLRARAGRDDAVVGVGALDLLQPEGFGPAVDAAVRALGSVDGFVVSAGLFAPGPTLEADLALAERVLRANCTGTILLCEHARRHLLPSKGQLVVFSSVAGDRGRKPIAIYGASKAGLSHYLESVDHRFSADGLRVLTVKPGFVRTAMTAGLPEPPFAGEPDAVAKRVLAAMDAGKPVVYAPAIWALVMLVIRLLPRFVMRRVGF